MRRQRLPDNIVLIGGPPCQAYSVVGRSRNRGTEGYKAENDQRHFLYREYLQVINEFRPAAFVMENVKGILSSRVSDRQIFETITADLKRRTLPAAKTRNWATCWSPFHTFVDASGSEPNALHRRGRKVRRSASTASSNHPWRPGGCICPCRQGAEAPARNAVNGQ
ncbi:MAG: DNA cytosine methyltransferase [Rubrivivax sp.]|nr:DNA cytosine methyltransferase [Rubrivivax sp.]